MDTLFISRKDVELALSLKELIAAIEKAYVKHATEPLARPQRAVSQTKHGSVVINFPGALAGYDAYTVKTNAKTPANPAIGLPFVLGAILMLDCETGQPLAVMESSLITAMRTCAAGAVGVATLARRDANKVAIVGAGDQGAWQLRALHSIGRLQTAWLYDKSIERSKKLAETLAVELNVPIKPVRTLSEALEQAEIVVTATQSVEPLITSDLVRPGMHLNAFGADEPGKVEIDAEVLLKSTIVVDDRKLALSDGTLNVAHKQRRVTDQDIHAEIGDVLTGRSSGRRNNDQITIFGSVGLAYQDVAACGLVYERALSGKLGTRLQFL